jgi:hypothetical protein
MKYDDLSEKLIAKVADAVLASWGPNVNLQKECRNMWGWGACRSTD